MQPEPKITINGVALTEAQAMTVRCALNYFSLCMDKPNALGSDQVGKSIAIGYHVHCVEVAKIMQARPKIGLTGATSETHDSNPFEIGTEKLVENGDDQGQAILSIAASLKRIADVVDPVDQSCGKFLERFENVLHSAIDVWLRSR